LIKDLSTKLAVYFLYKRSLIETLPDPVKDDYKFVMVQLKAIQNGQLSPFEVSANPAWVVSNTVGQIPLTTATMTSPNSPQPYDRFLI
jgi:hypothetical protein